jgi:hypothetical protein
MVPRVHVVARVAPHSHPCEASWPLLLRHCEQARCLPMRVPAWKYPGRRSFRQGRGRRGASRTCADKRGWWTFDAHRAQRLAEPLRLCCYLHFFLPGHFLLAALLFSCCLLRLCRSGEPQKAGWLGHLPRTTSHFECSLVPQLWMLLLYENQLRLHLLTSKSK